MSFYSLAFFIFVVLFIVLHELVGEVSPKHQWIVRLIAGLTFFTYLSGAKIVFVLASAVSVWDGALLIHKYTLKSGEYRKREDLSKDEKKAYKEKSLKIKRAFVAAIIAFNLLLLILVKYYLPITGHPIALPIGISFYTLMAVSYLVDVYGGKYEPQTNFAKVLLYLCWFPQLIQGPINRYDQIREELYKPFRLHAPQLRYAFYLFLFGAVKKYVIADLLAPIVNSALNNDSAANPGSFLLTGAVLFAIEQYADFSGGIDMSMGISLLFGVKMNENFKQPYFATSLAQFWRRWHITLGSFMRDYVFYPFVTLKSVSKLNKVVTKRFGAHAGRAVIGGISNIIVFALVGLWHGPEKHYLFWGLYNGIIIAVSDACAPGFSKLNKMLHINEDGKGMYCFRVVRTFIIVVFVGYFDVIGPVRVGLSCFKNTLLHFDVPGGVSMLSGLFSDRITSVNALVAALVAIVILIVNSVMKERGRTPLANLCEQKFWLRWVVCFALITLLMYSFTVSSGIRGFMYAAF